ncbi:hypothetical protein [uncultured Streptomyces sp.]|uniref:hypothetical protein n=1 Tax=uncultured Streptomyces sp. TaxID=174707 RepID=UPI002624693B|nr:hypothetical protein [uncultured Streptomyces sp.]
MNATERRRVAAGDVREAEDALMRLRKGLAGVGVHLPSLRLDPVSSAGNQPTPLIDLGRCNVEVAILLSKALEGRAACCGDEEKAARHAG